MTRGYPTAFETASQDTTPKPLWLIEINTDQVAPNDVLRYCTGAEDVTFDGESWTTHPYQHGAIVVSADARSPMTVTIADADGTLKALDADLDRKRVTVYRVDRDLLSSSANAHKDTMFVESVEPTRGEFILTLAPLARLIEFAVPRKRTDIQDFPGITREQ